MLSYDIQKKKQGSSGRVSSRPKQKRQAAVSQQSSMMISGQVPVPQEQTPSQAVPPVPTTEEEATQPAPVVDPGTPECTPQPFPRATYLQQPGASNDDFGITRLDGTVAFPAVGVTRVRGGVKLQSTDAVLPPLTSAYTQAGSFLDPTAVVVHTDPGGECPPGRYPIQWTIDSGGAEKIRDGEAEHCSDLQYAFNISIRRYAETVNTFAANNRVFRNERHAKRVLERTTGVHPDNWQTVFRCLAGRTRRRDRQLRLHTPRLAHTRVRPPRRRHDNCAFARRFITARSLPGVGQRSTPSIISGCGERIP